MSDFAVADAYVAILGVAGVLTFVVTLWLTNWRRIYAAIAASLVTVILVWCVCSAFCRRRDLVAFALGEQASCLLPAGVSPDGGDEG